MRLYFLSQTPAVLKLNGLYVGTVDRFERHVEADIADNIFAEIVPDDNLQPVNFFLNDKFLQNPPPFADVYRMDGDALIHLREYAVKDVRLDVVFQTRFCGTLVTVFSQGGIYLSVEGTEYILRQLPPAFAVCRAEEKTLAGRKALAIYGGDHLLLLSESGKIIFLNPARQAEFGDDLTVTVGFDTCTAAYAVCRFCYDGEKLTLQSSKTIETRPPEKEILHFAFFESVLTCGDFENYLDASLLPKAKDLKSYLGNFVGVCVPPEKFFMQHGNLAAAGLVYPIKKNLFDVRFFAVEYRGDKICNIFPVEE